jgi:4-amino-4-deoxy-L-arabinose transferase-like glycosyltransferase
LRIQKLLWVGDKMQNSKLFGKAKSWFAGQSKVKKYQFTLFLILLLGFFLRIYQPGQLFMYGHDNDLAGWIIKDIVVNRHLRLIGQETSTQGIFIGPLFYYLLIPFYLLFNMDPIGGVMLVSLLGVFGIASFYFVFSKVFEEKTGLIAAFVYALSFYMVFNDREVVPTMPVVIWTVWFFYAINLLLKGKQEVAYVLLGILVGLIWHLNLALVLLLFLIPIAQFLSGKKLNLKAAALGISALFVANLPLLVFETRHHFSQTKAVYVSFTTHQHAIISGLEKLQRVVHLTAKNAAGLLWGSLPGVSYETTLALLLLVFAALIMRKVVSKNQAVIMSLWLLFYILFFSFYSKILSEYYLNGMMVIWIGLVSLPISYLIRKRELRRLGVLVILLFAGINLYRFFSLEINKSGYLERKAIVAEIKKDAEERGFPCVAVSYITKPGYDLGYRYFYWLEGMHVNHPESGSPVYSIVFPLRKDIVVHKTAGAIGLIYPDYKRYTKEGIEESCQGENSNLTDAMFGYTE